MVKEIQNQTFLMLHVATRIWHVALYSYSMSFFLHYSMYMIPPPCHHQLLSIAHWVNGILKIVSEFMLI